MKNQEAFYREDVNRGDVLRGMLVDSYCRKKIRYFLLMNSAVNSADNTSAYMCLVNCAFIAKLTSLLVANNIPSFLSPAMMFPGS